MDAPAAKRQHVRSMAHPLSLEIWSDFACPWCWVGKRRLEAALARFEDRADVAVRRRAFELDPAAPPVREPEPYAERLARKYATSLERAREMVDTMTRTAAADGLEMRFDRIRPGNTFDAHRLQRLAEEHGPDVAAALHERLFRAYLNEGEALGDRETLVRLAAEVGLDPARARATLAGEAFVADVRADEAEAHARGVHAVPHFRIGGLALSGAQPPEVLLQVLRSAAPR
jgi:predicted DsbA family dithiol-disulfide isomerase